MTKRTIFCVCILISAMFCFHISIDAFVTDGLVSYWTFDREYVVNRTVKDVWGENNARIIGNPKLVDGKVNEGIEFDGKDDYVDLTNLGDFGSQIGSSSFEAWFKVGKENGWMSLFGVEDDCIQWNMKINTNIGNDIDLMRLVLSFNLKDLVNGCRHYISSRAFPNFSDKKWHHIVYTNNIYVENDGAGRKIYQNNIFFDGTPQIGPKLSMRHIENLIPFDRSIFLGCYNRKGVPIEYFVGSIDEVRIYNRALTQREVTENYQSRIGYNVERTEKLSIIWGSLKSKK